MLYRVVGAQRFCGEKSKKTGRPYDFGVLHCVTNDVEHRLDENVYSEGLFVEKYICNSYIVTELPIPCLVDISFDRFGRVERVENVGPIVF